MAKSYQQLERDLQNARHLYRIIEARLQAEKKRNTELMLGIQAAIHNLNEIASLLGDAIGRKDNEAQ